MRKIKLAAIAAILMAAATASASGQQRATQAGVAGAIPDGKVAVINSGAFPTQLNELKQKYEQVENQYKDRYQKLQALDQQLKQLEEEIKTKGPALAPERLREMQINYEDMKKKGTRDLEDLREEYAKSIDTATQPVRDKLFQFMQGYAAQRGIILILDLPGVAQTGSLAYVDPKANITEDFINEYNKANPVPGSPAAAQPSAAAPRTPAKPAGQP